MVAHKYTEAEKEFFKSFVPGHSHKEIMEEHNRRFEIPLSVEQVKGYIHNHQLNTGRTGRFEKGRVPHNKGKKGVCGSGCENTWFQNGHLPHNTKPIGYERVTRDGYIEVKIKERPNRKTGEKNFKPKHHIIWEKENGPIPKGYMLIFLDGDKQNVTLENLALISRAEHLQMTRRGLRSENKEITKTGVLIARAGVSMQEAKKRKRERKNEK